MNCNHPYVNPTIYNNFSTIETLPLSLNPKNTLCGLWAEINTYSCSITATGKTISWKTMNPLLNTTSQPYELNSTFCQNNNPILNDISAGHNNNQPLIYRDIDSFMQYYSSLYICKRTLQPDKLFMLYARRQKTGTYIQQDLNSCDYPLNRLIALSSGTNNIYIPVLIITLLNTIFPQIRNDAYSYSLLFNGRLPAGLTTSEIILYLHQHN